MEGKHSPITFANDWRTISWGRMHARVSASAHGMPPIVLVHGLVVASRYMLPLAERLAPLRAVYAIDLPGYGLSEKPRVVLSIAELAAAIDEWMEREGLVKAHFVGNSFGCQILAEFAARYPRRADRLVLQGPTVDPDARTFLTQVWRIIRNSARERPGLGRIMMGDYARAGPRRIIGTIRMALQDRIENKLPYIEAPVLIVRGEHDPLSPQRWVERVCRLVPRGELAVIPGAHTLNYTSPDALFAVMKPFLNL
jgi:pimeloyl-ACP methyl ester carboxylesterase